jgi:hypothetical protein
MTTTATLEWFDRQGALTLERLLPRLEETFAAQDPAAWGIFRTRLEAHFPRLFGLLLHLYGDRYDFFYHWSRSASAARRWPAHEIRGLMLSELGRMVPVPGHAACMLCDLFMAT